MKSSIRLKIIILYLCILGMQFMGVSFSAHAKENFKIVCIHSYSPDYSPYESFNRKIKKEIKANGIQADLRIFYLDCEQYLEKEETQRIYNYIDTIQTWEPDVIVVNDDQATYSLLSSEHPFLRRIPIVFGGVIFPNWELLKKYPNVTGFWNKPNYLETSRMIERLLGKSKIRIFYDNTFLGKKVQKELTEQVKQEYPLFIMNVRDSIWYKDPDTEAYLLVQSKMNNLTRPDSTIFLMSNLRDCKGNQVLWTIGGMNKYSVFMQTKYDYTTMRIGQLASIPTFTVVNEGFGYQQGMLGGYITTIGIQVKEEIGYACRLLKGESIDNLPIVESQKEYVLDWEEVKRWNISLKSIPDDYRIINMPFHERYPVFSIIFISAFSILIVVLIIYLMFLYIREAKYKKEAQLNLWKEKEFLSLALEDSNIFAWRYDLENDRFNFDKEFFEKLKMKPQIINLEQITNMILPEDRKVGLDAFYKVRDKEESRTSVQCRCDFNGKGHIWYEYRYINTMDSLGKTSSIIGLIINIQEYKDKEEALVEAKDLAAKAELKQSFLANMSHEIRTPLNAIVGFSNLLANENELSEEEKAEFIKIINKNCDLLLKLINDILEISRIESGNMTFFMESCNLTSLVEDIYSTHMLMMPDDVEFRKELPAKPVIFQTDITRLKQVISNFINNATKFTTKGFITVGYHILAEKKEIQIYVVDSGKGIPLKEQKMIFDRFYKQDEFAQGTGLGLSISQVIIEKLGGQITLKSEEGKGSCFTIIFRM